MLYRDENGYTWAIVTNSTTANPDSFSNEMYQAMSQALGTGIEGSPVDLYPQYPSPQLPARTQ
jgi:hypothetical protein